MSIRFTRPSAAELRLLVEAGTTDSLTYEPVGISAMTAPPSGYRLDRWSRSLGDGDHAFDRAVDALRHWRVHAGAGLVVRASGPPTLDRQLLARAFPPVARRLQVAATNRCFAAMQSAVNA